MAFSKQAFRNILVTLLLIFSQSFAFSYAQVNPSPLILSGRDAGLDEYDFIAFISARDQGTGQAFSCTGSFIHPQYIVTAAHCLIVNDEVFLSADELRVRYGNQEFLNNENVVLGNVSEVTIHPDYRSSNLFNDIAVIKLSQPAQLQSGETTAGITPVELGLLDTINQVESGAELIIAGWGLTEAEDTGSFPDRLQIGDINLVGGEVCDNTYFGYSIETSLCADNRRLFDSSVCSGDSGGPLFIERDGKPYLLGVTSAGPEVCGERGLPDVFSSVCVHLQFLEAAMGDEFGYVSQRCPIYPNPQAVIELDPATVMINKDYTAEPETETGKKSTSSGSFSWSILLMLALMLCLLNVSRAGRVLVK